MATFSTLAHAVKRGNAVEGLNSRRNLGDENLFHGTAAATDIFLRASVHDKIAQEDNLFHETDPSPPSDSICVTDENGVYGSEVEGGLIPLTYYFELEVNRSEEVTEVVLPAIENAIIDRLLALFVQVCGGTSRLGSTRRLELVGLASSPQDTIFEGLECKEGAESPCYVVEGQMSLFSTTAALQDKSAAIEGIKSGCEDDAFVAADTRIMKINYISDISSYNQAIQPEEPPEEPTPVPSNTGGGGIGFLPIVLSAIAGVALLVVAFLVMQRRSAQEDDEDISLMNHSEPVEFLDRSRSGNRFSSIDEGSETGSA
eukprot:CAMPEP_0198282260 /NCGR_PEP_ID=MMETSP1449-20131203/2103_1 /TAXON_ID=420275 /ORGANISM="Attheya septentrionalis, Strain CCMP2084" /LENGTH=314 /DNA_ID=CAMNT_0043978443 /DNA_START=146 /DNA_END=1090 /DNA_ORIENTATION=-